MTREHSGQPALLVGPCRVSDALCRDAKDCWAAHLIRDGMRYTKRFKHSCGRTA